MRQPSPQPNLAGPTADPPFTRRFWLLVVVGGVGAGLAGAGLMMLLDAVQQLAWRFGTNDDLLSAIQRSSPGRRVLCLGVAGVWVGAGGLLLRRVFGAGSDLNGAIWHRFGRVPTLATLARAASSIVGVGLGISLGRESAVKQAGGALASGLAEWAGLQPAHRRVLVACGVGAGMGAAYNVPFGGALFALEVLLGNVSLRLVLPAAVMATVATATSWLILPTGPVYSVHAMHLSVNTTVWALLAGPAFGALAAVFVKAVAWGGRIKPQGTAAVLAPMLTLPLLGVVSIAVPQLLGNGMPSVQLAFDGRLSLGDLLTLPGLKVIAVVACLACGARGGLFTPTMMIGAVTGGLLGYAWGLAWPGPDPGLCAMIGAGAVLAAATQGPVSAVVMMLELTHQADAIMVPMLLAVAGATLTAGWLDGRSIYSTRVSPVDVDKLHGPAGGAPGRFRSLPSTNGDVAPVAVGSDATEVEPIVH